MNQWINFSLHWDDAPLNISFAFHEEGPAGRHGFLAVRDGRFVFEDGTDARFWGVNFNSGMNFPPHDHSEKVAHRLRKFGVNVVRFHQLDAEWARPNIFHFERGPHEKDTLCLDPRSMERLDYLIHCLKQEGIYVYLDMLTYRRFKTGDGVESAPQLADAAKPYNCFDEKLIALQKQFNRQLWGHENPYTGLAYKDDPAIILTEVVNESDLFAAHLKIEVEPYRTRFEQQYRRWAEVRDISVAEGPVDFTATDDPDKLSFLMEVTQAYYREIIGDLRDAGVRIPIAGTNWAMTCALTACQQMTDFTDGHPYWWVGDQRRFMSRQMMESPGHMLVGAAYPRLPGKPHFISEWDAPWPNEYRADATLHMAAIGCLQRWQGFAIHTYRYGTREEESVTHRISRDLVLGGSYYRGIFDTYNDPAKFGLFYHAALIFRRGDVDPAQQTVSIRVDDIRRRTDEEHTRAWQMTPEIHGVQTLVPGAPDQGDLLLDARDSLLPEGTVKILSDNGQLGRDLAAGLGWIDAPRTAAVYGRIGGRRITLSQLSVEAETDFGTLALSSLTDAPLSSSENLLLTAIGRAENTGYREERHADGSSTVLDAGQAPMRVEVIAATVRLRTAQTGLRIVSIDEDGFITGTIPHRREGDEIVFTIGREFAQPYYLIQAQ